MQNSLNMRPWIARHLYVFYKYARKQGLVVVWHYLAGSSGCLHVLQSVAKRVQIAGMPAFMEPTYTQEELLGPTSLAGL